MFYNLASGQILKTGEFEANSESFLTHLALGLVESDRLFRVDLVEDLHNALQEGRVVCDSGVMLEKTSHVSENVKNPDSYFSFWNISP